MKRIPVTKGDQVVLAILDDEDYAWAETFSWHLNANYASRKTAGPKGWGKGSARIYLHRLVLEKKLGGPIPRGMVTDHRNRDRLDNRRSNLHAVSRSLNAANRARYYSGPYKGVYKVNDLWWCARNGKGGIVYDSYHETAEGAYAEYLRKFEELYGVPFVDPATHLIARSG